MRKLCFVAEAIALITWFLSLCMVLEALATYYWVRRRLTHQPYPYWWSEGWWQGG